jgi:hypothetical protein
VKNKTHRRRADLSDRQTDRQKLQRKPQIQALAETICCHITVSMEVHWSALIAIGTWQRRRQRINNCSGFSTGCSFFKCTSFVLYWIYDPNRIEGNYLILDVWMERSRQKQIFYKFKLD